MSEERVCNNKIFKSILMSSDERIKGLVELKDDVEYKSVRVNLHELKELLDILDGLGFTDIEIAVVDEDSPLLIKPDYSKLYFAVAPLMGE